MAARSGDRSGLPTDGPPRAARDLPVGEDRLERNGAPDPITGATPDADLVEAQLAAARAAEGDLVADIDTPEEEQELEELATGAPRPAGGDGGPLAAPASGSGERGSGEVAARSAAAPARKPSPASRLMTFLRGSWAELQRVQWPDRRQVMQATGVVVGFVIVAGAFLGVADWGAGKLMDFILR